MACSVATAVAQQRDPDWPPPTLAGCPLLAVMSNAMLTPDLCVCSVAAAVKQQQHREPGQPPLTLAGRPLLAVIVPVYAPSDVHLVRLLQALDGLSRQTRQLDYLVLVDDGSPLAIPSTIRCIHLKSRSTTAKSLRINKH